MIIYVIKSKRNLIACAFFSATKADDACERMNEQNVGGLDYPYVVVPTELIQ